ncbi:CDT1-like protein a, chloroplastic isoform X1 [Ananas comosus]|uniref:CDT1-like protein a, chloroplastic isoform X1 n=1 Tax=Ananas comosus TaxID=4615 RepID=A0A6P5ERH2_ANACO|nr:CDT1-like protein a, chloroplastic isoform X1 [Ananas comosus]
MEPLAPSPSSSSKKPPIDPSPAAAAAADDDGRIWTPEKPPQLPRRSRNRSLAFSVKEVKQAALQLQRPEKGSGSDAAGADLGRSDDALSFVERQLRRESDRRSSPLKPKPQIKLPEKYEILCEFFNSMESSIRLLRLKGSMLTFPNICTSIQHLTERRFTYEHLAQIKHILSEAILIKKVLLRDETTCCMKPELQITLQLEAVGSNSKQKGETGYSILRRLFRERLVDFFKEHPKGNEIPVAELPHPFNRSKPSEIATSEPRAITDLQFAESPSISSSLQQPVVLSHMSQSFRKRFSQKKDALPDSCTTSFACIRSASQRDDPLVSLLPLSKQSAPKPPVITKSLQSSPISLKKVEGTPAKVVSTPIRLMTATPDLQTPKRCYTDKGFDSPQLKKVPKRSARTKLFNTPTKNVEAREEEEENRSSSNEDHDDILGFLPKTLLQSIREKERKALEDKQAGAADIVRRQKLLASLPGTFDMILLIYQSLNRTVMTKQELIYKIIASHSKIADRGEVEEQLKLLQELVPDWISEKTALSGDLLCCVNMIASADEIRQRLVEAE